MSEYRYQLEKWSSQNGETHSNKHICPSCGKKTFVRVIDTYTGEYLPDYVGICDRKIKCGYSYSYGQYFREHKNEINFKDMNNIKPVHMEKKTTKNKICVIEPSIMLASLLETSNLKEYLLERFYNRQNDISNVFEQYKVGGDGDGRVIFWEIDMGGQVRTGKIMSYDRQNGHRIKNEYGCCYIHAALKKNGILPTEWTLSQVLFGTHLLATRLEDTVCLVESEKTALICSALIPENVWLATGGLNNFRLESCSCLSGRKVIIYPDLGGYDKWVDIATKLAQQIGFNFEVSRILEDNATDKERSEGLDIADYLLKYE